MTQTQNKPSVIWYFRDPSTKQTYEEKHRNLLKVIDDATASDHVTTLAVSEKQALGDTEAEFQASLQRIIEAELHLQIDGVTFHPRDLRRLRWRS